MDGFFRFLAGLVIGVVLKFIYDRKRDRTQTPAPPDAPGPNGRKRR